MSYIAKTNPVGLRYRCDSARFAESKFFFSPPDLCFFFCVEKELKDGYFNM